jgi:Asp/Glu/hydantoin racemase
MTRIALIHALSHSPPPVNEAMLRLWPEAQRMNLLDDSLSGDLARAGGVLTEAMTQRFVALADYAVSTGAQGILFTCSAFGPCIDVVAQRHPGLPVLKPNEAMVEEALACGQAIGLVASFAPTLHSMPAEFGPGAPLLTALAEGALAALDRGEPEAHDAAAAEAASRLVQQGARVIALAQFSLARARERVAERTGLPVLTTVDSAVRKLRRLLAA